MRRFRTPSWVGGEKEKKVKPPKPLPPLRHRISGAEKELDRLDDLELELHRSRDSMDDADWLKLENILYQRRQRADKRLQREEGITQAKPIKPDNKKLAKASEPLFSNGVWWAISTFVVFILFF